ncbi:MAG TPA: transglutaminase-like domain-containing protein [Gammaproteobacteria bacterium]|nr:transglutaminase-like domain-containing protein [Gammaproteobacteria bacterium]
MFDSSRALKLGFEEFAKAPDSVVDGALLVSRVVEPATDAPWCRQELERLARRIGQGQEAAALLEGLRTEGFAGAERYYEEENSALDTVLRRRSGIPISLAVVVIGIGEQLGIETLGINFPGHFLVSIGGRLADPYTLRVLDEREQRARVAASGLPAAQALKVASPAEIVLRMLNNLRGIAQGRDDFERALELTDYQLALAPRLLELRLARADLWQAIGAPERGRADLETALSLSPPAELAARIRERLQGLDVTPPTLH